MVELVLSSILKKSGKCDNCGDISHNASNCSRPKLGYPLPRVEPMNANQATQQRQTSANAAVSALDWVVPLNMEYAVELRLAELRMTLMTHMQT
eukprot:1902507-Amphidinium_carterae.1